MAVVKVPHLYKRNIRDKYKAHVKDIGEYQIRISDNGYYLVCKKVRCKGGWYPSPVLTCPLNEGRDLVDRLNKYATDLHIPLTFTFE